MTLAVINPGGWDPEEVLTSDQMNALQAEMVKAIDGVGGGSYTLTADLVMNGGGEWVLSVKVNILGDLVIESGAFLQVLGTIQLSGVETLTGVINVTGPGGTINVQEDGFIRVKSDGAIDIESGAALGISGIASVFGQLDIKTGGRIDVEGTGHIDLADTSKINLATGTKIVGATGSEVRMFHAEELTIASLSTTPFRLMLTPVTISSSGGVPDWKPFVEGVPTWLMHEVTGSRSIVFALPLRTGDVLVSLRMTLQGQAGVSGHAAVPANRPRLQLCSLDTAGTLTVVQEVTDPVSTPVAAYNASHSNTVLSGGLLPYTVGTNLLFVRVISESGVGTAEADKTLLTAIDGDVIAKTYRGTFEFYG
jgi:hypothetical protein